MSTLACRGYAVAAVPHRKCEVNFIIITMSEVVEQEIWEIDGGDIGCTAGLSGILC